MSISIRIEECRVCGARLPEPFLNLGNQPLANNLLKSADDTEPRVPLELSRCPDCALVQLTETVDPEVLFRDYVWVSGTARTTRDYAEQFCHSVLERVANKEKISVSEVASNDGTFLKPFKKLGHRVQGIDPARNIAAIAEQAGIPTYAEFFGQKAAEHLKKENGLSDIVIARNVIPHVADVNDVIAGMAALLKPAGTGVIEFHDASIIQKELHYDSVYHEHLFYFTLTTLGRLLNRHGLSMFDITTSPISGGSIVVYFSHETRQESAALTAQFAQEADTRINDAKTWHEFALSCQAHRQALRSLIDKFVSAGVQVLGYGASARSSTMLNFCQLDSKLVSAIADQNALKHGLLTPGTHIPISAPSDVFGQLADTNTVVLLLAWNFADEIIQILRTELAFEGEIVQPLPNEVEVICR